LEPVSPQEQRIPGWCPLCRSRCGCISVVRDGRLVGVERYPEHPTGQALCAKGQAAPEIVYSPDRLLYPMKRTRPKGDADPGWVRIGWDEALELTATAMQRIAKAHGPESVAFGVTTPSGTGISDSIHWIERLMRVFGSPNDCYATEVCNWHKDIATAYTFGVGIGTPDLVNTGCVILWGHNPGGAWLAKGQRVAEAKARGAALIVVDPRRVGPAAKADQWLRVRPGTDGALALGIAGVMITHGWFDREFVHRWSNACFLVHEDQARLLTQADLVEDGRADRYVVWNVATNAPKVADPTPGENAGQSSNYLLEGDALIQTINGSIACRPVFEHFAELCRFNSPQRVEAITGVSADQIEATAKLLWESRPVCYYAWSGVGQHTNATQTDRAISILYALTGSHGSPGGNIQLAKVPTNDVSGSEFVTEAQRAKTLGLSERPLGPARDGWVTSDSLYRAIIEEKPYPVHGLINFGRNFLIAHADVARGMQALEKLEFYAHVDLFLNPTANYADVVLPANSPWEREALRVGFDVDQAANSLVQFRPQVVPSLGESRDDGWIAFELAKHLGLQEQFWQGDREASYREILEPSGIDLDELRAHPEGISVPLDPPYRRFESNGGFETPTRRVEIWSETFRVNGYDPLPVYKEPAVSPVSRPDLIDRYPLVLTSAKPHQYCHGQFRQIPRLRKLLRDPRVEMHPDTAKLRSIADGDWVELTTPTGRIVARALLKDSLAPNVVAAQHGWWQACEELGLPGYPVHGEGTANFNVLIDGRDADPISGSMPHRSYLCDIARLEGPSSPAG
jgi:anaerobic selenocysteine-containing dehydrogenase